MLTTLAVLSAVIIALRATDTYFDGVKGRRKEKRLEAEHRRRLELVEKVGDVTAVLITDRELAGTVYDQLEAGLKAEGIEIPRAPRALSDGKESS